MPIPQADFVTMHGLWSWVSDEVRAGIVRLLATKTRPGGLVHLSYNALPAWQGALGMQRLIYETGIRAGGRSDAQAQAGLALARDLKAVESKYLTESSMTRDLLDTTVAMSTEYLSHEYMSAHWAPAFHADVVAALAGAKLDWVSSVNPMENFPELMLTPEQREVMNRYKDPILRELIKDMCLPRQLRHDVFVRGARRMYNEQRDAALSRLTVMPIVSPGELQTEIRVPAGMAEVGDTLKGMMVAAMRGPATIGELLALGGGKNPAELVSVLVGSHQCQIAVSVGRRAARVRRTGSTGCSARACIRSSTAKTSGGLASSPARHRPHVAAAAAVHRRPPARRRARGRCRRLDQGAERRRRAGKARHRAQRRPHRHRAAPADHAPAGNRARLAGISTCNGTKSNSLRASAKISPPWSCFLSIFGRLPLSA